jgi:hypothetical protein
MDDNERPTSMDFQDTVREIARLLTVLLGAIVLAHLGFLIVTWFRAHGHG